MPTTDLGSNNSNRDRRPRLRLVMPAFTAILALGSAMSTASPTPEDNRQVFGGQSPHWMRAVGKLQVPGSKLVAGRRAHHLENCTATLVSKRGKAQSDTIVTAWHCLEFYTDLSRPITFTLHPGSADSTAIEARRLADGGGMHADWALLRLRSPIPAGRVKALHIHPQRASPGQPITMAGYSKDDGKGNKGNSLTFDADCRITAQAAMSSDSDCTAHKGASGGPVVQLSGQGLPLLSGVISRGDGSSVSIYVPVGGFRGAINRHLH